MDAIAQRYGVTPSELISRPIDEYLFDEFVWSRAMSRQAREAKKSGKR